VILGLTVYACRYMTAMQVGHDALAVAPGVRAMGTGINLKEVIAPLSATA
jgi:hypothetical protein